MTVIPDEEVSYWTLLWIMTGRKDGQVHYTLAIVDSSKPVLFTFFIYIKLILLSLQYVTYGFVVQLQTSATLYCSNIT